MSKKVISLLLYVLGTGATLLLIDWALTPKPLPSGHVTRTLITGAILGVVFFAVDLRQKSKK